MYNLKQILRKIILYAMAFIISATIIISYEIIKRKYYSSICNTETEVITYEIIDKSASKNGKIIVLKYNDYTFREKVDTYLYKNYEVGDKISLKSEIYFDKKTSEIRFIDLIDYRESQSNP